MSLAKTKVKKRRKRLFNSDNPIKKPFKKTQANVYSKEQIDNFAKLLKHDHKIYRSYSLEALIIGFDEVGRGCVAGPVCSGAYSCSSFYNNSQELLHEIKRSQQIISDDLLNYNDKDLYYSETIIGEVPFAEELQEVQYLSSLLLLDDSKKVPHEKRNMLCQSLLDVPCFDSTNHIFYATDLHSAQEIDQRGIVECIWSSMATNLINITLQYIELYRQYPPEIILLVDGPKKIANLNQLLEAKIQANNYSDLEFVELDPNPEQQALDLSLNTKAINLRQICITKGDSKSALIAAASNLAKQCRDKHMQELSEKYPGYLWHKNVGYCTKKHIEAISNHGLTDEHRKTFLENFEF